MPPPSSGGIAVAQILGTLQALETQDSRFALPPLKPVKTTKPAGMEPAPEAVHVMAEAERLAYADRGLYVADSDFVPVPIAGLVDPGYLASRAALISERSMGTAKPGTRTVSGWPTPRTARPCAFPPRRWWRQMTRVAQCR